MIVSDTNFAVSRQRMDLRHTIQVIDGQVALGHHVYPQLPLAALVDALLERVPAARRARPKMTGWELGNACRRGSDPIVVVFNNGAWEMLRAFRPQSAFKRVGLLGLRGMAAGMGGEGHRVTTRAELVQALRDVSRTRGRFQLPDVRLAPGALSQTLPRFVAGVKRLSMPGA